MFHTRLIYVTDIGSVAPTDSQNQRFSPLAAAAAVAPWQAINTKIVILSVSQTAFDSLDIPEEPTSNAKHDRTPRRVRFDCFMKK